MRRPAAVLVLVAACVPLTLALVVRLLLDNTGGGSGPLRFATNDGGPTDQSGEEFVTSNEPCGRPAEMMIDPERPGDPAAASELAVSVTGATIVTFGPDGLGYLGSQAGEVWVFDPGDPPAELGPPTIDLTAETSTKNDQGLLGLAVDPIGTWLYLNRTDARGDSVIDAYPLSDGQPDPLGREPVLLVDQPTSQHNGGGLAFGPDGFLYATFGDGGGQGDPHHNAQDPGTVLGSVVRFEPRPGQDPPAAPAPGNPFTGDRDEAWSWMIGLRNPFRLSFDSGTGDLWIGDVGQQCTEEIDHFDGVGSGGENLGWNLVEGDRPFLAEQTEIDSLPGYHEPLVTYHHRGGQCAVIGGTVYRGSALPDLVGWYVFSDLCGGRLLALEPGTNRIVDLGAPTADRITAVVADPDGELWIVSMTQGLRRVMPT